MKIGILGYGTVASGLVDIIDNNKDKRDIKYRRNTCQRCKQAFTENILMF